MTTRLHTAGQHHRHWGARLGSVGLVCAAVGVALTAPASSANGCVTENVPGHPSLCWTHRRRGPAFPPGRVNASTATDPASGKVVLFGGANNTGEFSDTWTWDGTTWTQQSPAASPPARDFASMATDPGTGHVVLFGGYDAAARVFGDTWTWDGANWTQRSPAASPPARAGASMATDPTNAKVVLFGGAGPGGSRLGDTWTWDGTNWIQRSPATSPSARAAGADMATDPAGDKVVLFAGTDLADTWTWDGTTWTQQSPATSPPERGIAAMATDSASGHVVLFGGGQPGGNLLGDTWTWDGTNWTQQSPATSPPARFGQAMATDPNGRVLVFGGLGNRPKYLGDTWSLTPSLTITPNSGPPGTHVSVRGFGYTPGGTVTVVKYRTSQALPPGGPSSVICTATVAVDTSFTCTGKIPKGAAAGALGPHDIVAKDSAGLKSRTQLRLT